MPRLPALNYTAPYTAPPLGATRGVEHLGGDELGDALRDPAAEALVLGLHDGDRRSLDGELLGRPAQEEVAEPGQAPLGVDRELRAREQPEGALALTP